MICREKNLKIDNEEDKNEKDIKEYIIEINDEIIPFTYYYKFNKKGKY